MAVSVPLDPHTLTPSQLQYGIAPKRDPHVIYARDVILMEEGDKAIRMCGSDGLTWVFDAAAPHVSEFQEGRIVFATGRAVGRIGQLQRNGDTVTVRLAPVQITEVVQQGHFIVSGELHPENFIVYSAPDLTPVVDLGALANHPATAWQSSGSFTPLVRTAFVLAATGATSPAPAPAPAAAIGNAPVLNLPEAGFKIRPLAGSDSSVGVELDYAGAGVHLGAAGRLRIGGARVDFELKIVNSVITKFGLHLSGLAAMELDFKSYTEQERFVNVAKLVEPYVDMTIPMPVGGLPLSLTVGTSFVFRTGFSAKSSWLAAKAKYSLNGDLFIGKDGNSPPVTAKVIPTAVVDLGKTATGMSVGINFLTIDFLIKPMVGIGAFGFTTGVYAGLRFGGDVLKQSSVALRNCRRGDMRISMISGVGYRLSGPLVDFVNTVLSAFTRYRLDRDGDLVPGPKADLMTLTTEAPGGCAGPAQ